jgi:hypothetical protein
MVKVTAIEGLSTQAFPVYSIRGYQLQHTAYMAWQRCFNSPSVLFEATSCNPAADQPSAHMARLEPALLPLVKIFIPIDIPIDGQPERCMLS